MTRTRFAVGGFALALALLLIAAFPAAAHAVQFNDVEGHWAEREGVVEGITELGIIKGVENADGTWSFKPNDDVKRAEVAMMLARYAGADVDGERPKNTTEWPDVKDNAWYTAAMIWAEDNGIFKGGDDGKVNPDNPITRQELATVLHRYADYRGDDTTADASCLSKYSDASKISTWAKAPIAWAVENGIMGNAAKLNPASSATRAEAAKMILVFVRMEDAAGAPGVEEDPEADGSTDGSTGGSSGGDSTDGDSTTGGSTDTEESDAVTYEDWLGFSAEEQEAWMNTFDSMPAFFGWYNTAKKKYEEENPSIEIGPDGSVDMGDILNGKS